jgi:transcriptional regulator with XRE-family HTH domain
LCLRSGDDNLAAVATTPDADHALGATVRALRERNGRSQEAVARAADLSLSSFGRIERAEADPTWSSVVKIADALDVTLVEFAREIDARRRRGD